MLSHQNIICVSSIDWDFLWQQHQEIMSTYAANGNTVLFIENTGVRSPRLADVPRLIQRFRNWRRGLRGFRQEMEGLYVYSPLVLPFPHSRIARRVNRWVLVSSVRRWMRSVGFRDPILWAFLPTWVTLDLARAIGHRALVYYCSDNFGATSRQARKVVKAEREVIRRADVVFAMSGNMLEYCRRFNPTAVQISMGVRAELFEKVRDSAVAIPDDLAAMPRPVVGYVGGVRQWIDQELVRRVAEAHPEWSVVFVGPLQTAVQGLAALPNVRFLGPKPHAEVPRYVKFFDCCILPYLKTEYTDSVSPAKLHEYLIMGKPVVSTNLAEVERTVADEGPGGGLLYVAKDHAEFVKGIEQALSERGEHAADRIALATRHAWGAKIEAMSALIQRTLEAKEREARGFWQERFRRLRRAYSRTWMRAGSVAAGLVALYLALFHTPLLWLAGEPLRIVDAPGPADAIVVFGGGVGESGMAGQGFEERVVHAVDLYRAGYARHVIFSTGYTYTLQEALVMRALAIALGVPAEAIVVEDKARNTYENVAHVRRILDERGWRRVLVVSSPYHMRRVSLVFQRVDGARQVRYTPVLASRFYARPQGSPISLLRPQMTLQQLRGILHEYAGIVSYWRHGQI